jgi:hypothetical protein
VRENSPAPHQGLTLECPVPRGGLVVMPNVFTFPHRVPIISATEAGFRRKRERMKQSALDRAMKANAVLTNDEWEMVKLQEDRRRFVLSGDQLAAVFGMLSAP